MFSAEYFFRPFCGRDEKHVAGILILKACSERSQTMGIQLQLELDHQRVKLMRSTLMSVDQSELVKGLSEIFFNFIQVQNKGVARDESHDQRKNQSSAFRS